MFFNDGFNVLRLHTTIKGAFRVNDNQRSMLAEAMAACFYNHNLILQAKLLQLSGKSQLDFLRAVSLTARTATH